MRGTIGRLRASNRLVHAWGAGGWPEVERRSVSDEFKLRMPAERADAPRRGRPGKNPEDLKREIRSLRRRLSALRKRALQAEAIVRAQMEYVRGAALKLERKDRGLLSAIVARVRSDCSVSDLCEALSLTRRDFYRTIKPLLEKDAGPGEGAIFSGAISDPPSPQPPGSRP
jgi:hypothetical protein